MTSWSENGSPRIDYLEGTHAHEYVHPRVQPQLLRLIDECRTDIGGIAEKKWTGEDTLFISRMLEQGEDSDDRFSDEEIDQILNEQKDDEEIS